MHPNNAFRKVSRQKNIDFSCQRSFGILAINGENGPLLSHIPFQLSEDGKLLEAHLVRSNPILKLLKNPQQVVIAVSGPDSYISPDWYEVDNQVPTWNYVAVHLRGQMRLGGEAELRGVLERLSQDMETRLLPKPIWKLDKVDDDVLAKMSRMIVPIFMDVETIDGTWKLAQNKADEARISAAREVSQSGFGSHVEELAALMKSAIEGVD